MKTSIALCTYNGEKYLEEQLNSYLIQSSKIDEIVVCDDASTDSTWDILNSFKNENQINIRLYRNEHSLGVMSNFQQAISYCTGDIILLSDQDDIWLENKVAYFKEYFKVHKKTNLLFSNAKLLMDDDTARRVSVDNLFGLLLFGKKTQRAFNEGFALEMSHFLGRVSGFTIGIRREQIDLVLPFDKEFEYFIHDRQLVLYFIQNESISFTNECLALYRLHANQTSNLVAFLDKQQLLNKKENVLFLFPPLGQDVITYLRKKGKNNERFVCSETRSKLIKSPFALLKICFYLKDYRKNYQQYFLYAIKYDMVAHLKRVLGFLKINKR